MSGKNKNMYNTDMSHFKVQKTFFCCLVLVILKRNLFDVASFFQSFLTVEYYIIQT